MSSAKRFQKLFYCAFVLLFLGKTAVAAPLQVADFGETGWQTYSYTFFTHASYMIIGVSNAGGASLDSKLLLDNFVVSGELPDNPDQWDPSIYGNWQGTAVTDASSFAGTAYSPTEGLYMTELVGTSYIDYWPPFISYPYTLSFDWNFLAFDYLPFRDFVFIEAYGRFALFDDMELLFSEKLAEIAIRGNPVPEPSTALLLGIGLGITALAGRKMSKAEM